MMKINFVLNMICLNLIFVIEKNYKKIIKLWGYIVDVIFFNVFLWKYVCVLVYLI